MKTEHKFALIMLVLFILAAFAVVKDVQAEPFGYVHKGTYMWVPDTGANQLLDLPALFGVIPDLIIVRSHLGSSGTDFRLRMIQTKWTVGVGLDDDTNSDLITTALSAAQKDTLFDQGVGDSFGAVPVSAAGETFYGNFYWALAPAATDTIVIEAYDSVR